MRRSWNLRFLRCSLHCSYLTESGPEYHFTASEKGLLRFMEPSVTVKCRPKDKGLTEKAAEGAKQQYTEISGLKAEVSVEGSLTDDM